MSADRLIKRGSPEWVERLDELGPLPPLRRLFARGLPLDGSRTHVAIVGTRRPTVTGLETAMSMAKAFAEAGFVIVSGLAIGIDTAAHRACLAAGGHTVAVLGCGLDVDYPKRNARIKEAIGIRGTLVSEYDIGVQPRAHHFPQRNRIVAGLAHAVVVIEGGSKSGSLITARIAIEAGREVFAVPGSPRNVMAGAPNELIRTSQAALASCPEHVFEVLAPSQAWTSPYDPMNRDRSSQLEPDEAAALLAIDEVPASPARIGRAADLPSGRTALVLARLEVRGLVRRQRMGYEITEGGARARVAYLSAPQNDDRRPA